MRWTSIVFVSMLAACASMKAPYPEAQNVIDGVAAKHPDLVRLTLHAVPSDGTECTQLASTVKKRRGKPSDPEDLQAMKTGREVVLEEEGALDVTVPIRMQMGKATAVVGVTLPFQEGDNRNAVMARARGIAREVETALRDTGKPAW